MMRLLLVVALVVASACEAVAEEHFRWDLLGTEESREWQMDGVPDAGAYSVRMRLALASKGNKHGSRIEFTVDGVRIVSDGGGINAFDADGKRSLGADLRNRRYHDFVFVVDQGMLHITFDGDERKPLKANGPRGFKLVSHKSTVDVAWAEVSAGDMSGIWTCRNLIQNGGFETLANGYPFSWTTGRFGFGTFEDISNAAATRMRYRIDSEDAFEGTNAMRLAVGENEKSFPLWECWRARLNDEDYVLSVYVKALKPGTHVRLMAGEGDRTFASRTFGITNVWTRLTLPFHYEKGSQFRGGFALEGPGEALFDAAQLERGHEPTQFVTCPCKCEEVPPTPPQVMDTYYSEGPFVPAATNLPMRFTFLDPVRNSAHYGEEEYFPYGFNTESPYMGRDSFVRTLDLFATSGFNYIKFPVIGRTLEPGVLKEMLDAAWDRGIRVMLGLQSGADFRQSPDAVAAVTSVKGHPALMAVSIIDEGSIKSVTPEVRQERADEIRRALDGRIPVFMNECDLGVVIRESFSAADIASVDVYEVGFGEISSLYYVLKQFHDQVPERMKMFYPMSSGGITSDWPRDATREEVLAQAYIGYVLEMFGIVWWQGVPLSQESFDAVVQAKRERDIIDPSGFLNGTRAVVRCASRNDAVKFTARRHGKVVTVIAVNIENRRNWAAWEFPMGLKGTVRARIGDVSGVQIKDGLFLVDSFGPLERRVFEVDVER